MQEYEIYSTVLTSLNTLITQAVTLRDKELDEALDNQRNRIIRYLDEQNLRVTWHPSTQSYTVSEMPNE